MAELALITSDLHLHPYKNFNEGDRRLKNGIDYLNYIFRVANKEGIKYIVIPGDIFNNMQIIATKVVNAVDACLKENFDKYSEITIIAISGNHDQCTKNLLDQPAESALEHLAVIFDRFILLDKAPHTFFTEVKNTIVGINYYEHAEHFIKILEEVGKNRMPGKVHLLTHQSIGSGLPIEDALAPEDPLFAPFDFVYNGHIHNGSMLTDKFVNVGSPMHRDAGDIGKEKGCWIVDLDDPINTISFVDITKKYPQFIYKFQGEELTEEESKQYVIWVQPPTKESAKDAEVAKKFNTSLAPAEILTNFAKEVLPEDEVNEKLTYVMTLL
jgi:DNA repair exonuclease SbcCD nuclease subunit